MIKGKLIASFRQGSGPMAMNAIDFYETVDGIIKHEWAMGGESKKIVNSVPEEIKGYEKISVEDIDKEANKLVNTLISRMEKMTDKERWELIYKIAQRYCYHCGDLSPCGCWNDE